MDKMDSANLVSLMGGKAVETGLGKKGAPADKDMFARILEQHTGKGSETQEKGRDAISQEKKGSEKNAEANRQAAELQERLKARLGMKGTEVTSLANYLYNIVLQNPDALSMSEKQAFHLGEFAQDGVGFKELQTMLTQRGLSMNNLSFTQLAQLTQRNSRGTITAFLDQLLKESRQGQPEGPVHALESRPVQSPERDQETREEQGRKDVEGKQAQPSSPTTPTEPQAFQPPTPTASTAQTEELRRQQREEVIKQIIARMDIQTVGNRTELTIKLNPEYLGDLRVKLSSQNGRLEAQFETTSQEVRAYIDEGMTALQDMFASKGLNLAKVNTKVVDAGDV